VQGRKNKGDGVRYGETLTLVGVGRMVAGSGARSVEWGMRSAGAVGGRRLWRRGGRRAFVHNLVRNEKALIFTALRQI